MSRAGVVSGPAGAARGTTAATVRPYSPSDRARVLEIIGRVWDEPRRRTHAFLWDWKHARDREAGRGRESIVVERDGRVMGYAGAIPARFRLGGELVDGAFCIDTFTDPEARGLGKSLMRWQVATGTLILGAGNERARALYARLSGGRVVLKEGRKMACVIDPAPLLERRRVPAPLAAAARLLNRGARRLLARPRPAPAGFTLEPCTRFPGEVAALCADFGRRFRHQLVRDADWLNWRFIDCPFGYQIRLLRDHGRLSGYVVYRLARLNGRRVLLLVEMVASGDGRVAHRILLDHVEQAAVAGGACEIETLDPGCPVLRGALRRKGYFRKGEALPIIGRVGGGRATPPDFYDGDAWWLGAGDADFEFIFFNQGEGDRIAGPAGGEAR
jgi:hypothetical protein